MSGDGAAEEMQMRSDAEIIAHLTDAPAEGLTAREIAEEADLSRVVVGTSLRALEEEGLVRRVGAVPGKPGPRAVRWRLA